MTITKNLSVSSHISIFRYRCIRYRIFADYFLNEILESKKKENWKFAQKIKVSKINCAIEKWKKFTESTSQQLERLTRWHRYYYDLSHWLSSVRLRSTLTRNKFYPLVLTLYLLTFCILLQAVFLQGHNYLNLIQTSRRKNKRKNRKYQPRWHEANASTALKWSFEAIIQLAIG